MGGTDMLRPKKPMSRKKMLIAAGAAAAAAAGLGALLYFTRKNRNSYACLSGCNDCDDCDDCDDCAEDDDCGDKEEE